MKKAMVIKNEKECEVRCSSCGKLLFTFSKKSYIDVDNSKQSVKIVSRCTRNTCKCDNVIYL